jgi:hypothetical protein
VTHLAAARPHHLAQPHDALRDRCASSCLAKNHGNEKGRALSAEEQAYIVVVICRWIERELA